MSHREHRLPVRPKLVCTSSAIRMMPLASQSVSARTSAGGAEAAFALVRFSTIAATREA